MQNAAQDGAQNTPARTFAELTTLRVGGPLSRPLVEADGPSDLVEAVRAADADGTPVLVLGGGSNLVVGDEGFGGVVVRDRKATIEVERADSCGGTEVVVSAGTPWDQFVAWAVGNEYLGVEALSGIPGSVGAAPVQNIGAYGQEAAETISRLRVWDRLERCEKMLPLAALGFGYRTSILKRSSTDAAVGGGRTWGPTGRYVVLEVAFQMRPARLSSPVRYAELARRLDVELEDRVPSAELRAAVLELRAGKGMVLDSTDHDSWSAGSFFTNPILTEEQAANLPQDAPRFPVTDNAARNNVADAPPKVSGPVKTSAAWLIDHAGFKKGYTVPGGTGRASLSTKHVLALTNRGGATGADIVELARTVRDGVRETYGVTLVPEPVTLGCEI